MRLNIRVAASTPEIIADALEEFVQMLRIQAVESNAYSADEMGAMLDYEFTDANDVHDDDKGAKVIHPFRGSKQS